MGFKFDDGKLMILFGTAKSRQKFDENLDDLYKNKEIRESRNHMFFSNWQLDRKALVLMVRGRDTNCTGIPCSHGLF